MKYYKVTNNEFYGFYDKEIHSELLFTEDKLNDTFFEISEKKWQELLDGQSEGKEIRILKNGELGLYQVPHLEEGMINPIFDYDKEMWIEQATDEEILEHCELKLVEVQKDIKLREELGLMPSKEQLALKSKYMNSHINICHTIALKENS